MINKNFNNKSVGVTGGRGFKFSQINKVSGQYRKQIVKEVGRVNRSQICPQKFILQVSSGGKQPPTPPTSKELGGSGDDDGEGQQNGKAKFKITWKGWEDRVATDPQFFYKVLVEQIVGVGAAVLGDMSARPNWGINELDFVFSTLVVGSILNFLIMYILAPTAGTGAVNYAKLPIIQKFFGEQTLKMWGAPGGNMFEPGYGLTQRLINLGYKGLNFAVLGMTAGLLGTGISNVLIECRKKFDSSYEVQNESPNIIKNSAVWAFHMGVSSNLRYQSLNGLDRVISKMMPDQAFKFYSVVIRTANNVVGGLSFVYFAKLFGVQKTSEQPASEDTPK